MELLPCEWRRRWHPTPVLLPGKSHGRRSLVGCSPWGHEELDKTERLHFHFSLACTGEGNSNPLPCSCLENPRDGRAWWAAIYGVAQSRTRLKQLGSSNSLPCEKTAHRDKAEHSCQGVGWAVTHSYPECGPPDFLDRQTQEHKKKYILFTDLVYIYIYL